MRRFAILKKESEPSFSQSHREGAPLGGGEEQRGGAGVLAVADGYDAGQVGGDLHAVATGSAGVAGLAPLGVCEVGVHGGPSFAQTAIISRDASGGSATARSMSYKRE